MRLLDIEEDGHHMCLEHKLHNTIEAETHVNLPVLSPTVSATEDRIPLKEGE
jgi:hypothetical protein